MVHLTLFKESNGAFLHNQQKKLGSVQEAVQVGQRSGTYYEILDTSTGRIIDWNEVNIREEEEWYYDEAEMIWKRLPRD